MRLKSWRALFNFCSTLFNHGCLLFSLCFSAMGAALCLVVVAAKPGLHELLEDRVASRDDETRLFSQRVLSKSECRKAAKRDLKDLLKKAPSECHAHLKSFYCELAQEVEQFNTCAQLEDKKAKLHYYECITRPTPHALRKPFVSECQGPDAERTSKQLQLSTVSPRLAFLVLAHRSGKNVWRLVERIHSAQHIYLVHVDLKSPEVRKEIDAFGLPQLETFSEVNVTKGGNDLLRISMLGLQRLLKKPGWKHLIKLSEFDFPVMSLKALEGYLWLYDLNYVGLDGCHRSTCSRHLGTSCRGEAYSFVSSLKMHKPLSFGMKFARGSEWLALTWDFCHYLAQQVQRPGSAMHEVWTDALMLYQGDETFFQTAVLNSFFCSKHAKRSLHYIPLPLSEQILHGRLDEVGTRSPRFLTLSDWEEISKERLLRPIFFARKVRQVPPELLLELKETTSKTSKSEEGWPGLELWFQKHFADCATVQRLPGDRWAVEAWRWKHWRLRERVAASGAVALRLGTAWRNGFRGSVNLLPLSSAFEVVSYWAPKVIQELPLVLAEAAEAEGTCRAQEQSTERQLLGEPLVLRFHCKALLKGLRRLKVRLKGPNKTTFVAWRHFLVYDSLEEVSFEHMSMFFDLEEVAEEMGRGS